MRILSITAQKPDSTGSGVYLTELVKELDRQGHDQAVVAGIYEEDRPEFPENVRFYPVYFAGKDLSYPIVGMSDEMPYESTRYCDMTPEMVEEFKRGFREKIQLAVDTLNPDLILCHHLYLLTASVREWFQDRLVFGFCHNTDLRQMQKTDLERGWIAEQIRKLDRIFVPQEAQKCGVLEIYQAKEDKVKTLGMGYNDKIFYQREEKKNDGVTRIVFAGKISEKKGVKSLIRSMDRLYREHEELKGKLLVFLAGGAGNAEEYQSIVELAAGSPCPFEFLGKLSQTELAKLYNACDIFVLPSFFDGLPLTVIEALACADRVVVTELPGIRPWLRENAPGGDIRYVEMPRMKNTDEPLPESLPAFEDRLKEELFASIRTKEQKKADVSRISWKRIAQSVVDEICNERVAGS